MADSQAWYQQADYDVRCEWGLQGVKHLAPISDVVIIVDVLSFTTSVCIALERGAYVYPYAGADAELEAFARARDALVADRRGGEARYSLAPHSLLDIPAGTRLVMPSPNGSTLSSQTGDTPTLAGCLRNASSVARAARRFGRRIAVIPAGERWRDDGTLRPSFEDLIGAGAILGNLDGSRSPEAASAVAAWEWARHDVARGLRECGSGRELIARGSEQDVALAAEVDVCQCAPLLQDGAYRLTQY